MMKKLIPWLLCMLLMTSAALAASTEEEWNESCNWVIAYDTTLYSGAFRDDATTMTDLYEFNAFGSIAAGARVSIRSSSSGMREIYYWENGKRSAWVEADAVKWAGGSSSSGSAAGSSRKTASSGIWADFDVTWVQEDGTETDVTLETLGTAECVVFDGDEMHTVPTSQLVWETEAPEEQRLAVIYAPKTGKCTLRASASSSAKSLGQCDAGRIVVVLKVGKVYTRILYEGKEGCVLNSTLEFYPVAEDGAYGDATLSYKGRTDSSATISVYTATDADRKIEQWRVGNDVVTLGESGSWTEIEIDGWHGFVKTAYLE